MADIPKIVLPHGGYKKLIVYRKSDVIYYAKAHADWPDWQKFFETRPADTVANLMLTICHQTRFMLDKMISAQEEDFKKHGGVRERVHAARTAARGEEWDKGVYSRLDAASDAAELEA